MFRYIPLLFLCGCTAIPPAVQYATTATSIGIWAITGKTTTDHVLSYVNDQDCELVRVLDEDDICVDYEDEGE